MNPQTEQVLNLIKRDGSITRLTAMHYGIANLTARIAELRNWGFDVECQEKRDANGRRYGTWSLKKAEFVGPPDPRQLSLAFA